MKGGESATSKQERIRNDNLHGETDCPGCAPMMFTFFFKMKHATGLLAYIYWVSFYQGVENVYAQHVPLVMTTVEAALKGKLKDSAYPAVGSSSGKSQEVSK